MTLINNKSIIEYFYFNKLTIEYLKMQSQHKSKMNESLNKGSYLRNLISQTFTSPTSIPPFFQYLVTLFEFMIFSIFISSNYIEKSLIFKDVIGRNTILFLSFLLVLRCLTRMTLIKSIYVLIIVWNVQCQLGILSVVVYVMLLVHIAIDIVSKIQFSFQTKNMHSSTYPWFIAVHYAVCVLISVLRFMDLKDKQFIFPICQLVVFGLLVLLKFRTIDKYDNFKNIHLRFYFLCMFYAIAQIYEVFVQENTLLKNLFAIITSQLFYQFIQWRTQHQFTVQQYTSKKMQIQAGFYVFSFLYSKNSLNNNIVKALRTLSNQDTNCLIQQRTFKQSRMKTTKKGTLQGQPFLKITGVQTKQVSHRLVSIMKQSRNIYGQLFMVELILYQLQQHIKCRQIITAMKMRQAWYNILSKIMIDKIQKKLIAHLNIEHDKCVSPNFYEFIQNDKMKFHLLKSALNFISLWQYTKVRQGIYKKINELAEQVIVSIQRIQDFYQKLKVKCIQVNLLYGNYLFYVARDTQLANQIMENLYFYQQKQLNLETQNKMYISISIDKNQPLRVSNVGSNVNKLLGYERRLLIGMNLSALVPQFYKDYHDSLVINMLQNQTQRLFLFSKSTIVKHAKGNYETGLLCLRLSLNEENEMYLQGFLKIITDETHNWHNYLFVNHSTRQIIECSPSVSDKISQGKGKKFSIDEFFDHPDRQFHKKMQKFTSQLNKYIYEPFLEFQAAQDKVTMFVEIDPYAQALNNRGHGGQTQFSAKKELLIPQMIVYPKYKVYSSIIQLLRRKVSTKQILQGLKSKLIIMFTVIFVLILSIYVLQGVNIVHLIDEYQNKVQTMVITDNIVRHYMGLSKIGVDLSYLVVNQMYGYSFPDFQISLKQDIMTVQQTNQYFKQYSISQWQYESLSTVLQYRTCYQFISEILASASLIDKLPNSPQIQQSIISAFNQLFTETYVWSYPQYTTRIQEKLAKNSQNRNMIQIIKVVILCIFCIVLYIFLIKVQSTSRMSQYETLRFIGSITFQDQVTQKCKQFITMITEQRIQSLSNKTSNFQTLNKQLMNQGSKLSEATARENTGRQLMGNDTGKQTGRDSGRETWRTAMNPLPQQSESEMARQFPIKLRSADKLFIILPLLLLLIIIALQVSNYIINSRMKEINQAQSSRNIVQWMNKPLFFTRLVNAFLTQDRGLEFTDHDGTFNKSYKAFQQNYNSIASFQEIDYAQFKQFEEKLRKIRFEYLCTYAKCPSLDKDYVNILYTTTMQKLANYMLANQYFLNDPNHKMNTVLLSEQLFREIMTQLIQTYIKNYKQYTENYKKNQLLLLIIIIVMITLLLLNLVIQAHFNIFMGLDKHFRICEIVKEESYLIDKESLISFEDEVVKRQKLENRKKITKKKIKEREKDDENISQNRSQITHSKNNQNKDKSQIRGSNKQKKTSIFKDAQKGKRK